MTYDEYEKTIKPLRLTLGEKFGQMKKARREFGEASPEYNEAVAQYKVALTACEVVNQKAKDAKLWKDSGMSF
jgi:hypothetical protein